LFALFALNFCWISEQFAHRLPSHTSILIHDGRCGSFGPHTTHSWGRREQDSHQKGLVVLGGADGNVVIADPPGAARQLSFVVLYGDLGSIGFGFRLGGTSRDGEQIPTQPAVAAAGSLGAAASRARSIHLAAASLTKGELASARGIEQIEESCIAARANSALALNLSDCAASRCDVNPVQAAAGAAGTVRLVAVGLTTFLDNNVADLPVTRAALVFQLTFCTPALPVVRSIDGFLAACDRRAAASPTRLGGAGASK
jgi:hypothetical protein